ncbi:MAG: hypothetical protein HW416_2634, partial [Chloroflexi bacterium]|nr:hypothetical protein [Chloroflexota bacterium]
MISLTMQMIDGAPVYSATDLVGYLACQHLTALDRAAVDGVVPLPWAHDAELEVLRKRGFEHERRFRATLEGEGKRIVEILPDASVEDYSARIVGAARATEQAMADGVDVIYQGTFFGNGWRGHPDFLLRVDDPGRPSRFGPYHYEVADTKLARAVKAGAVLQICSYVDQLEGIQRVRPDRLHVVLGGSARRTETLRVDDFMAYYRNVKYRFQAALADADQLRSLLSIAPDPVDHCRVCRWSERCDAHRHSVDHLSLVANISARQRVGLTVRGITTLEALGSSDIPFNPPLEGTKPAAAERVREQARIQLEGRNAGKVLHELLLPVEPDKGLSCLPAPSTGDLFFDIEGDPYAFEDGFDYLFGVLEPSKTGGDGRPLFHAVWSRGFDEEFSLEGEKLAFERLIDLIMDRLRVDPNLHVYHYAPYEPTALKRLMGRYGTSEEEVDCLLRGGVLVDLYRAVRQGLRAAVESYSIKKLEPLYGYAREVELRDATSSIVAFEHWLQLGSDERPGDDVLDRILAYNRDDVVSTWQLRDWLEAQRSELLAKGVEVPRPGPREAAPTEGLSANLQRVAALEERLLGGVPVDAADRTPEHQANWLLGQMLSWHRREEKSGWWRYFHLMDELTDEERIEEKEPLGGLEFIGPVGEVARSTLYRYRFPPQDYEVEVGRSPHDPATGRGAGEVYWIDERECLIDLKRGKASTATHPTSLVPDKHVDSKVLQESLLRLGEWVAANDVEGKGPYRSARDVLLRAPPRVAIDKLSPSGSLQRPGDEKIMVAVSLGVALDHSVLAIQGPPGSGKTYIGARMIVAMIHAGMRVGVTANSHKVIGNLLDAVCRAAADAGVAVRAVQKADEGQAFDHPAIRRVGNEEVLSALRSGEANLAAGTAWLWARPEMAESVDVLFVDEAGQLSLANALA